MIHSQKDQILQGPYLPEPGVEMQQKRPLIHVTRSEVNYSVELPVTTEDNTK